MPNTRTGAVDVNPRCQRNEPAGVAVSVESPTSPAHERTEEISDHCCISSGVGSMEAMKRKTDVNVA